MNQRKSIKDLFKDLKYKTSYKENNIFCVCKEIILNSTKFFFYIKDDNLILLNSNKKIISDSKWIIRKNGSREYITYDRTVWEVIKKCPNFNSEYFFIENFI
jgi:hypothetical protein